MPRRFATPRLEVRAYLAHQNTRKRLRTLTEQAEDEQRALDYGMADLLAHFPHGLREDEVVLRNEGTRERPRITITPAPADGYEIQSWADVEERGAEGEDEAGDDEAAEAVYAHADTFGQGTWPYDGRPPYAAPAVLDHHQDDDGSLALALAGIEVRDDDGDDH